jgi:hypothetical protein
MPQKIKMFISNGTPSYSQLLAMQNADKKLSKQQRLAAPSALSAPIISRIHNVRPGCNSCGK